MNSKRLLLPAAALAALLTAACSNEECEGNRNALPFAGFYSSAISPRAISLDSITIYGVGAPNDTLIADSARSLSEVYLPFDIDAESTTFVIEYLQKALSSRGIRDEITFTYTAQPWFVSSACGVSYRYLIRDISYTTNVIDSVSVPGMMIDNTNAQNIRIYFRVNTEE